jgi:glucan 1,3-beta-glucosidase
MKTTSIFSTLLLAGGALAAPLLNERASGFAWGKEKARGVNIGGWLVLEP